MGFKGQLSQQLSGKGQLGGVASEGNQSIRNAYPAMVVSVDDPAEQNRIVARIVKLDDNDQIIGGRDRDVPDKQLPFCNPLVPEFVHVRPLVGEMVIVILENPSDNSAPRYWMGPVITSKLKLKYQSYADAESMFAYTDFFSDTKLNNKGASSLAIPRQADIALQGRDDADIILRPREVYISAGKFVENSFSINEISPCNIQLKQFDNIPLNEDGDETVTFSQQNFQSNNINLYSPFGKFREPERGKEIESTNTELEYLGGLANSLHPAVFGDELIVLLDLLVRVTLNHIHTPHVKLVETDDSNALSEYTLEGKLQDMISKFIRIN
jgi:hypothetical protein